ncbi:branched-chain amino acid ABC transporter permease [Rhizobium alvei]|uniref:Branched-chain amino acid ABC transporter permease n=1 Tax=Rhizobium alvei TaxID=1132659 RepID=A0ABT8YQU9_9HYPH|nr:branched-chain amino acid ABC transporter permease [Rhizobium alvei]MDO6965987.1 branched-chain amino acid ABC transporter permease [Rhizobium alvei]
MSKTKTGSSDFGWVRRALKGGAVTAVPVILIGVGMMLFAPNYYQNLAAAAVLNLIIVVGLQIFMGNSGLANFGHSVFVGLGAYGMAILATPVMMKKLSIPNAPFGLAQVELHPALAAVIALAVVAVIAVFTGRIISRLSGEATTIVTLALLIICHSVFLQWPALFKGNQAFFGIPKTVSLPALIAFAVFTILIARLFRESPSGMQLRATADNPRAAEALAIDARALRRKAWLLSALVCGLAGVLYASFTGTISPRLFYFQQVLMTLAMLILGGLGTVTGAVIGTLILSISLELIRSIESGVDLGPIHLPEMLGLSGVALGAVIVFCMILRPQGLSSRYELDEALAVGLGKRKTDISTTGDQK